MKNQIKKLIIDMDGVLWHGETPVPGLGDFFETLGRLKLDFVLATNNASKTPDQYVAKLARFGLQIPTTQITTSALATGSYLSQHYAPGTPVYVVGELGLRQAVANQGFQIITPEQVAAGESARLVVAGFNPNVTYRELAMASLLVHRGATFVGSNADPSYPSELGPLPGAGALLAVISTATGIEPIVIGKPGPIIFQEALRRLNGSAADTAMVGDRLTTDIAGGKAAGLQTILVLSGISKQTDIKSSGIVPDYIFEDITALAAHLKRAAQCPDPA